ncbi:hypothetical protein [[Actinomadura] parvosata]|uniref:hypothetical protein n=1 Tax=[Actinomadura] parvosata TaxID=1955412 RepID=UPI0012BC45E5|nr:hypothetical protein [Nonomuraea sp. ATCC 55076]
MFTCDKATHPEPESSAKLPSTRWHTRPTTRKSAAVHADIAAVQLRIGDLNQGITSGHLALETAQSTESRWAFQQLAVVENALTGKRDASARELLATINSAHRSLSQSPA